MLFPKEVDFFLDSLYFFVHYSGFMGCPSAAHAFLYVYRYFLCSSSFLCIRVCKALRLQLLKLLGETIPQQTPRTYGSFILYGFFSSSIEAIFIGVFIGAKLYASTFWLLVVFGLLQREFSLMHCEDHSDLWVVRSKQKFKV